MLDLAVATWRVAIRREQQEARASSNHVGDQRRVQVVRTKRRKSLKAAVTGYVGADERRQAVRGSPRPLQIPLDSAMICMGEVTTCSFSSASTHLIVGIAPGLGSVRAAAAVRGKAGPA
eukprot:751286-Hanusia_phi.AAC.4